MDSYGMWELVDMYLKLMELLLMNLIIIQFQSHMYLVN